MVMSENRSNNEKLDFTLLCTEFLRGLTRVMEDGMKPEGREANSWKEEGPDFDLARTKSLLRHVLDLLEGNLLDSDSGLPQTDHIAANAMLIRYHQVRKGLIPKGPIGDDIKLCATRSTGYFLSEPENECLQKRMLDKIVDKPYNKDNVNGEDNDG